ncbi:hypothetical protein pb186bvf_016203 [Paramecium bursaria]
MALKELGYITEAISMYDLALRINPNDATLYYNKAQALHKLKQYKAAIQMYDEAIRINPGNAIFSSSKGVALKNNQQYGEAIKMFDVAIRINPNNASFYTNKRKLQITKLKRGRSPKFIVQGDAFINQKHYQQAIHLFELAIALNPKDEMLYSSKGKALFFLRQFDEARKMFDLALNLNPNISAIYNFKGVALKSLGLLGEVQKCMIQLQESIPMIQIFIRTKVKLLICYQVNALKGLGLLDEAQNVYEELLKLNPNYIEHLLNNGIIEDNNINN